MVSTLDFESNDPGSNPAKPKFFIKDIYIYHLMGKFNNLLLGLLGSLIFSLGLIGGLYFANNYDSEEFLIN